MHICAFTYSSSKNYLASSCDSLGSVVQYVYDENFGTLTSTTDANGNKTNYTYDNMGRIKTVSSGGSTNTYDDEGIRTGKNINGIKVEYFIVDGKITAEKIGDTVTYYRYDENDNPISINYRGIEYYYVRNLQGDIEAILNSSGVAVVSYTYDAWGKVLSVTGDMADSLGTENGLRYRGYFYDREIGLYYLQSRYYDPEVGRFINGDDIAFLGATGTVLSFNLYSYCENNPVNLADPDGHVAANVVGAVVGGILGAVGGAILGNWLAKQLKLTGWKKWIFIGAITVLVGATASAIGYVVGPYIAKAWSAWSAKLSGLIKRSYKSVAKIKTQKMKHINVSKHLWGRVMKKVTTNQIQTLINQGIRKGTWKLLSNGSIKILYRYSGQTIVITWKVVNNVFQVGNAWVWNGVGTP